MRISESIFVSTFIAVVMGVSFFSTAPATASSMVLASVRGAGKCCNYTATETTCPQDPTTINPCVSQNESCQGDGVLTCEAYKAENAPCTGRKFCNYAAGEHCKN